MCVLSVSIFEGLFCIGLGGSLVAFDLSVLIVLEFRGKLNCLFHSNCVVEYRWGLMNV